MTDRLTDRMNEGVVASFQVRMMEGVACPEGVDTLLLHLLVDRGAVREATAFVSIPNKADAKAAAERLQVGGGGCDLVGMPSAVRWCASL